ncbi:protein of unknown function [Hyphomicrobium sp. 1Nfss2.1]
MAAAPSEVLMRQAIATPLDPIEGEFGCAWLGSIGIES